MSDLEETKEELHRIRAKLYPNYLPHVEGAYIARTEIESVLDIEQVCIKMIARGGFRGRYNDLVDNVKQFFDEMAYQLCDGYAINTGYYSIHPNIGGTFNSINENHDPHKHPISFKFHTKARLRNLINHIVIDITGLAAAKAFIDKFVDTDEKTVNSVFVPGNLFSLSGNKIKVMGDNPECGVYFVSDNEEATAVKVMRIADNGPSKITGIVPSEVKSNSRIEIRTQYTGSSINLLKKPRVIVSDFVLEVA